MAYTGKIWTGSEWIDKTVNSLNTSRKSAVSYMRKRVLGPGYSEHSGRGFYMMTHELSEEDFWKKMFRFLDKYRDDVEKVDMHVNEHGIAWFTVVLNADKFGSNDHCYESGHVSFGGNYRTFAYNENHGSCGVWM